MEKHHNSFVKTLQNTKRERGNNQQIAKLAQTDNLVEMKPK